MKATDNRHCTEDYPEYDAFYHLDAKEVPDTQRDVWPGGDTVKYQCPHCDRKFTVELPQ